jgi:hypothetical protein
MANRGFIHSFLTALITALVSFFLLYFFVPSLSEHFLGVSFSAKGKATVSTQVDNAVQTAVDTVVASPEFTKQSIEKLQDLLQSDEIQAKLKDAAKQGEAALKDAVQTVTDSVK